MIETYGEYKSGAGIIKIEWAIFSQMMHIGRIINVLGALCVATLGRSVCQLSSQRHPTSIRLCALSWDPGRLMCRHGFWQPQLARP